ncbi:MAG: hypothetical protein WA624_18095 [Methylocella sp.]
MLAAINAGAQNRITGIMKKFLCPCELLILLSMDRYLLSIDQCMAAIYLMRSMTFLPHPGQGNVTLAKYMRFSSRIGLATSA